MSLLKISSLQQGILPIKIKHYMWLLYVVHDGPLGLTNLSHLWMVLPHCKTVGKMSNIAWNWPSQQTTKLSQTHVTEQVSCKQFFHKVVRILTLQRPSLTRFSGSSVGVVTLQPVESCHLQQYVKVHVLTVVTSNIHLSKASAVSTPV